MNCIRSSVSKRTHLVQCQRAFSVDEKVALVHHDNRSSLAHRAFLEHNVSPQNSLFCNKICFWTRVFLFLGVDEADECILPWGIRWRRAQTITRCAVIRRTSGLQRLLRGWITTPQCITGSCVCASLKISATWNQLPSRMRGLVLYEPWMNALSTICYCRVKMRIIFENLFHIMYLSFVDLNHRKYIDILVAVMARKVINCRANCISPSQWLIDCSLFSAVS